MTMELSNTRGHATSSSSNRYNHGKPSQMPVQTTSEKYSYNQSHRDRDTGISFITPPAPPPPIRDQTSLGTSSSVPRGTFDYRSSSAISTSTSSSSGGSFISGLRDLATTNEKHLRFLDAAQNGQKNDIAMVMSLANTELLEKQKVRHEWHKLKYQPKMISI